MPQLLGGRIRHLVFRVGPEACDTLAAVRVGRVIGSAAIWTLDDTGFPRLIRGRASRYPSWRRHHILLFGIYPHASFGGEQSLTGRAGNRPPGGYLGKATADDAPSPYSAPFDPDSTIFPLAVLRISCMIIIFWVTGSAGILSQLAATPSRALLA